MSRANGVPGSRLPSEDGDICPVCKSSRYLNPNMRFLVNPECYHKMCESCVDRIFSHGPAPCPVAGCGRTLRKPRFRKQTFEDIHIEREIDIRKRIAAIFNRRESEFSTLLNYNNYLETVEDLTFNLIHNIDVPATEAKLTNYARQNASTISHNAALSTQESTSLEARRVADKEAVRLRREAALAEEEDERKEREEGKKEVMRRLAEGGEGTDADTIVKEAQKVTLKKSSARRTAAEKSRLLQTQLPQSQIDDPFAPPPTTTNTTTTTTSSSTLSSPSSSNTLTIKGLKPTLPPTTPSNSHSHSHSPPYDPFAGLSLHPTYYSLPSNSDPNYPNPWLDKARTDAQITAGGYDVREYYARTMHEAFCGLAVFVQEEMAGREESLEKGVASEAAAAAAAAAGR